MFELAIKELIESNSYIGEPEPFQSYLKRTGIDLSINSSRTANLISIYSIKGLHKQLREAKCTVFRLGSPKGQTYTNFALARVYKDWSDYFLIDDKIFIGEPEEYLIKDISKNLDLYKLLPSFSESSLVNFSLSSGLLFDFLGIRNDKSIFPVNSRGNYTFNFKPLSHSDKVLTHHNGSVEIDSFFIAKRNNKKHLFIVEAKMIKTGRGSGIQHKSLAKHKLLYPILSMKDKISENLIVTPIYIRFIQNKKKNSPDYRKLTIKIVECKLPRVNNSFGSLDELKPVSNKVYKLKI